MTGGSETLSLANGIDYGKLILLIRLVTRRLWGTNHMQCNQAADIIEHSSTRFKSYFLLVDRSDLQQAVLYTEMRMNHKFMQILR